MNRCTAPKYSMPAPLLGFFAAEMFALLTPRLSNNAIKMLIPPPYNAELACQNPFVSKNTKATKQTSTS